MKAFLETTVWETATPNHVYFLDDSKSKMYAYVKFAEGAPFKFKKPIRIDLRGRKFREVPNTWGFALKEEEPQGRVVIVKGSKGDEYRVNEVNGNWSCTCSGFKFRGDCRHLKQAQS
jgi:hypothetical protein